MEGANSRRTVRLADGIGQAEHVQPDDHDLLRPALGIAVGLLIGIATWGVIGTGAWYLL